MQNVEIYDATTFNFGSFGEINHLHPTKTPNEASEQSHVKFGLPIEE